MGTCGNSRELMGTLWKLCVNLKGPMERSRNLEGPMGTFGNFVGTSWESEGSHGNVVGTSWVP